MNAANTMNVPRGRCFENLRVYQQARELVKGVYAVTKFGPFSQDYGLVGQIRRAAVSVMANIAEGFERGGNIKLIQFLYIAKGSCEETRAHLAIAMDQSYIDTRTYRELGSRARRLSGMLANFIDYLKSSRYRGVKYRRQGQAAADQSVIHKGRSTQELLST